MSGVKNEAPDPNEGPPVKSAYQFRVPADAVAPNVTVPGPHRVPGTVPVIVGIALTDIVMRLEDAVVAARHAPPAILMSQLTVFPSISKPLLYVLAAPLCTLPPLSLKSYVIVPPPVLLAVAVNVTPVPSQTELPGRAVTLTAGVTSALIVTEAVAFTAEHPPAAGILYVTVYVLALLELGVIEPVAGSIDNPLGLDENVPPAEPDKITL